MRFRRPTAAESEAPRDRGVATSVRDPAERPALDRERPAAATAPRQAGERRGLGWRTRDASAAAVGAAGAGVVMLARLVMAVAALIALLILLAIVLRDVDANPRNSIVKAIHEGANFFAGAFTGLITFKGHPKREITVDWGIAVLAFLIAGAIVASFIARIGRGGMRFERTRRAPATDY